MSEKLSASNVQLTSICSLIGCSGMNNDCPGNHNCEIIKKVKVYIKSFNDKHLESWKNNFDCLKKQHDNSMSGLPPPSPKIIVL